MFRLLTFRLFGLSSQEVQLCLISCIMEPWKLVCSKQGCVQLWFRCNATEVKRLLLETWRTLLSCKYTLTLYFDCVFLTRPNNWLFIAFISEFASRNFKFDLELVWWLLTNSLIRSELINAFEHSQVEVAKWPCRLGWVTCQKWVLGQNE